MLKAALVAKDRQKKTRLAKAGFHTLAVFLTRPQADIKSALPELFCPGDLRLGEAEIIVNQSTL